MTDAEIRQQRAEIRQQRADKAKILFDKIVATLESDGVVTVATYTHAKHYQKKHIDWFRYTANGVYVKRGKSWDCIDYCAFKFYRRESTSE